jgi:hypothetical protein
MDTQSNHSAKILSFKTLYVKKATVLVKKINYGEDVSCCVNKMYLASRLINRLECFCFSSEGVTCYNCITTSDLPKMYEVLYKLLQ